MTTKIFIINSYFSSNQIANIFVKGLIKFKGFGGTYPLRPFLGLRRNARSYTWYMNTLLPNGRRKSVADGRRGHYREIVESSSGRFACRLFLGYRVHYTYIQSFRQMWRQSGLAWAFPFERADSNAFRHIYRLLKGNWNWNRKLFRSYDAFISIIDCFGTSTVF